MKVQSIFVQQDDDTLHERMDVSICCSRMDVFLCFVLAFRHMFPLSGRFCSIYGIDPAHWGVNALADTCMLWR